jgi:5'-3' exonuclease
MGIPSYFSFIIKNYPNIVKTINSHKKNGLKFDSLYMDCNSIIYDVYNTLVKQNDISDLESNIILKVIEKIEYYIRKIEPSKVLYVSFDGVAPLAKMEQQRTRRHKSLFFSNLNISGETKKVEWNTSAITPGTLFMNNLSKQIAFKFQNSELKYGLKKIITSGSDFPGEGEHKMFQHIRENLQPEDNVFVYGLDSDLIMLSLFHVNLCKNIYVFREAPEFSKSRLVKDTVSASELMSMDIHALSHSIINEMGCNSSDMHRLYDYILMCFFLGNDFLPHVPSLNIRTSGIHKLIEIYRKYIGSYPDRYIISKTSGKISWRYVKLLVSELAKIEHDMLLGEFNSREKMDGWKWEQTTADEKEKMLMSIPVIYRVDENYICPREKYWEDRYYKSLFSVNATAEKKEKIAMNYLEGLEWVFKYYTESCPDWRWRYKWNYPPLFVDLVKYIPEFETDFIRPSKNKAVRPEVQLAYVIPFNNHHLLSEKTRKILDSKYKHLYTEKYEFQWAFCRYLWEAHIILPEIDENVLETWEKTL